MPLPEFDNAQLQIFSFEKKFVVDCLKSQIPENMGTCEALMKDLQKMIKANSMNNSYKDEIKTKKSMKIEEIILFEQSNMGYVDRSIENVFNKLKIRQQQSQHEPGFFPQ